MGTDIVSGGWRRLAAAAAQQTPVRARIAAVDEHGATIVAAGVEGRMPLEDVPFPAPRSLEDARVRGLVTAVDAEQGVLVVSPRALAVHRCAQRQSSRRRVPVRVVATGEHGVLAAADGVRAWFPADDPPRRQLTGRKAGWVTAIAPHLVFLGGREPAAATAGALTAVLEGTVTAVDHEAARVRLDGHGSGQSKAIVPRDEIAWHPVPSAVVELAAGDRVRGRVIDLGLDGPVLSLREAAPSPWPAIALELPAGSEARARVRAATPQGAVVRLIDHPHVTALVDHDAAPGDALTAVVAAVDVKSGRVELERIRVAR